MSAEIPDFPPEDERKEKPDRVARFAMSAEELIEHGVINPDNFAILAYTPPDKRGHIVLEATTDELREALANPGPEWERTLREIEEVRRQYGPPR